jgi:hypothetical protein
VLFLLEEGGRRICQVSGEEYSRYEEKGSVQDTDWYVHISLLIGTSSFEVLKISALLRIGRGRGPSMEVSLEDGQSQRDRELRLSFLHAQPRSRRLHERTLWSEIHLYPYG